MSELSASQQAVLDALWALGDRRAHSSVAEVRERASARGHMRSASSIRRCLDALVAHGYARRLDVSADAHGRRRALYFATRRAGEHVPDVCQHSEFLSWLWEARLDWRLWSLRIGDRMVMVDNWGRTASAEEWTWLASRPALVADGQPSPADPAWWEPPAPHAHEAWLSQNPAASAMVQRGLQQAAAGELGDGPQRTSELDAQTGDVTTHDSVADFLRHLDDLMDE
jgi:hypothetical protein